MDEVVLFLRFVLATVLLSAGLAKLPNLSTFERAVRDYRLAPAKTTRAIAVAVPITEVVLGACVFVGLLLPVAAAAAACLLLAFSVAVMINLVRGRRISCGCIGTLSSGRITLVTLLRNGILISSAVVVGAQPPVLFSGLRDAHHHVSANDGLAMLVFGTLAVFAITVFEETARFVNSNQALHPREL